MSLLALALLLLVGASTRSTAAERTLSTRAVTDVMLQGLQGLMPNSTSALDAATSLMTQSLLDMKGRHKAFVPEMDLPQVMKLIELIGDSDGSAVADTLDGVEAQLKKLVAAETCGQKSSSSRCRPAALAFPVTRRAVMAWVMQQYVAGHRWSKEESATLLRVARLLYLLHRAGSEAKRAVELFHISKAGGSSLCQLGNISGCATDDADHKQNCLIIPFQDRPRWTRPDALPGVPNHFAATYGEPAKRMSCEMRRVRLRENAWNFYANEYVMSTGETTAYTSTSKYAFRQAQPCDDFLYVMVFRSPEARMLSHMQHVMRTHISTIWDVADEAQRSAAAAASSSSSAPRDGAVGGRATARLHGRGGVGSRFTASAARRLGSTREGSTRGGAVHCRAGRTDCGKAHGRRLIHGRLPHFVITAVLTRDYKRDGSSSATAVAAPAPPPDRLRGAAEHFFSVFNPLSIPAWQALAPAIVDNYFLRSLLGEQVFLSPLDSLTTSHLAVGKLVVLQLDVLLTLELPALNDVSFSMGLAWALSLTHVHARATSPQMRTDARLLKEAMAPLRRHNELDQDLYEFAMVAQMLDVVAWKLAAMALSPAEARAVEAQRAARQCGFIGPPPAKPAASSSGARRRRDGDGGGRKGGGARKLGRLRARAHKRSGRRGGT